MRQFVLSLIVTALLGGAVAAATATAAAPKGFKVTIPAGQKIECAYIAPTKKLQCLNYTRTVDEPCDAGGAVFATELARTGKAKQTVFCVDEAFHGWKTLKRGQVWKEGVFKCFLNRRGDTLRCSNKSGTVTMAEPAGAV